MAGQSTFGMILRDTRERKGIGLAEAARRLRIRPDILRAIEENDFARMPPRGYARNMVNAYARFLGLNPTEMTTRYLDEMRSYQMSQTDYSSGSGFDMPSNSRRRSRGSGNARSGSDDRRESRRYQQNGRRVPYSETSGRPIYSDRSDRNPSDDYSAYSRSFESAGDSRRGRTQRSSRTTSSRAYANTSYGVRRGNNIFASGGIGSVLSKLPIIIAAVVVIALLVFIITSAVSCATHKDDANVSNVPITGISDTTANTNSNENTATQQEAVVETAPTQVVFQYTVSNGKTAYIEIYEDDNTSPSVASEITGPETGTYQVTGTLKFVTTSPSNVKITVDGEEVTPTDNSDGIYVYNVSFADTLANWTAAHKSSNTSNKTNTSTSTSNANANTNKNTNS